MKRVAATVFASYMLLAPVYAQTPNPSRSADPLQTYLAPAQKLFSVSLRGISDIVAKFTRDKRNIPNPLPIVLHTPSNPMERMDLELKQANGEDLGTIVLADAIEEYDHDISRYLAEAYDDAGNNKMRIQEIQKRDPAVMLVPVVFPTFSRDITNIQYTRNVRIEDTRADGRAETTDAICVYFEFHPNGQENDNQYRFVTQVIEAEVVKTSDTSYVSRSINRVKGIVQAKKKSEPESKWQNLPNPTLDDLNYRMLPHKPSPSSPGDASHAGPPPMPGAEVSGRTPDPVPSGLPPGSPP